ncbi:MAG: ATP-binding cassette domain-containing protein [Flavobacteriales bacterium]|nr:ATP-binding cassette domain-containing protein [Flavobacteriales bacterium]
MTKNNVIMGRIAFIRTYIQVFKLLDQEYRKRFFYILLLVLVTSCADLLGLAAFIPVVAAVADESMLEPGSILYKIKELSGIVDDQSFLLYLFGSAFGFFVLRSAFILISQWYQSRFVFNLTEYIGKRTYSFYLNESYQSFKNRDSSKIVRDLTVSPQQFARFLVMPLLMLTTEFLVIIMIVVGMALYNTAVLIMVGATILPISYLFNRLLKKKVRAYGEIQNKLTPSLIESSIRGVGGFIDVLLRGKQSMLTQHYSSILHRQNQIATRISVINIAPSKIFELTTIAGMLMIIIYSVVNGNQHALLPLITVYAMAGYRMIPSMSRISPALLTLEQYQYLFDIYSKPLQHQEPNENVSSELVIFKRQISLKDVSFKFDDASSHTLEGVNLNIERGEVLGMIGKSGSGKTTLANVIAGFLMPTNGELLVDGVQISSKNLASWMSHISYVQQSPYLEKGSVSKNIAFLENEVDQERLLAAISGASLNDLLGERDPKDVLIEEGGKNLSGGQKQRVIIARALYHNSSLIVLDEATAALDVETENEINETVNALKEHGVTIMIIAHRYTTLKYSDRILILNDGRIVEETSYDKVVS